MVSFFWIGSLSQLAAQKLEIDLRTDTTDKKYVVGLAVRNDTYTGHAFVILYQQENIGFTSIHLLTQILTSKMILIMNYVFGKYQRK